MKTNQQRFIGSNHKADVLKESYSLDEAYRQARERYISYSGDTWSDNIKFNLELIEKDVFSYKANPAIMLTFYKMLLNLGSDTIQELHDFYYTNIGGVTTVDDLYLWINDNNLQDKGLEELKLLWVLNHE